MQVGSFRLWSVVASPVGKPFEFLVTTKIGLLANMKFRIFSLTLSEEFRDSFRLNILHSTNFTNKITNVNSRLLPVIFNLIALRLIINIIYLCKLRHRKKVLKIFENSFFKNNILEIRSEALFALF